MFLARRILCALIHGSDSLFIIKIFWMIVLNSCVGLSTHTEMSHRQLFILLLNRLHSKLYHEPDEPEAQIQTRRPQGCIHVIHRMRPTDVFHSIFFLLSQTHSQMQLFEPTSGRVTMVTSLVHHRTHTHLCNPNKHGLDSGRKLGVCLCPPLDHHGC